MNNLFISTEKEYQSALTKWKQELEQFSNLSDIPIYYISEPIYQAHKLTKNPLQTVPAIFSNFKKKKPDFISINEIANTMESFQQTNAFQCLKNTIDKDDLAFFEDEHKFLLYKHIGYFVYIHYPAGILRYSIGLVARYEESESLEDNEENDNFFEEDISEEVLKKQENDFKEFNSKILSYVKIVSADSKISIIKTKKQCINFINQNYPNILSENNYNVVALVAEKALDNYELELLPRYVNKLINENKSEKEISISLGISLLKVRKLIASISK